MSPSEMLIRLVVGLIAIGLLQVVSAAIAVQIREATINPVNNAAKRAAAQFT